MISSYNMMCDRHLRIRDAQGNPGERCNIEFDKFARNPHAIVDACSKHDCCPWHKERWNDHFIPGHINAQSHVVFTSTGQSMVDFIGRTENMQEDWAEFLHVLNAHAGTQFVPRKMREAYPTHNNAGRYVECLGRPVRFVDEASVRHIGMQFAMDVKAFGFTLPVPGATLK